MSATTKKAFYIGKETTPGTGVAVAVALRVTEGNLRPAVDKVVVEENIGSFAPPRHYIGSVMAEGSITQDGIFEQAPYMCALALGAGSVGAPAGGIYPWTFTWPDATAPTPYTVTAELTDGVNHVVKATDTFATGLEISGEAGQSWQFKDELTGGNTTLPAALSASPAMLAPVTSILMADTVLSIDPLYANIGTTPCPVLISFTWKLENLMHSKLFAGALYPTGRGFDRWEITLEVVVEMENSVVETTKDKVLTTDTVAIRLMANPSGAGQDFKIDGSYFLQEISDLDDRDGNSTIKMTFKGVKDALGNTGLILANSTLAVLL